MDDLHDENLKKYAVTLDIDGIIAIGIKWENGSFNINLCTPNTAAIDFIRKVKDLGLRVILWTARPESQRELTIKWLETYKIPFDSLVMDKPSALMYIDDRTFPPPRPDMFFFATAYNQLQDEMAQLELLGKSGIVEEVDCVIDSLRTGLGYRWDAKNVRIEEGNKIVEVLSNISKELKRLKR